METVNNQLGPGPRIMAVRFICGRTVFGDRLQVKAVWTLKRTINLHHPY